MLNHLSPLGEPKYDKEFDKWNKRTMNAIVFFLIAMTLMTIFAIIVMTK